MVDEMVDCETDEIMRQTFDDKMVDERWDGRR